MYIREGGVKLTVVNKAGKEAVVAILGPGDFFGEGCLAGQSIYMATATAIAPTTVLVIEKDEMIRVLHGEHEFVRPLHRLYAGTKHPSRRGPDRPALQLQRETAGAHAAAARALWQGRPASKGASQSSQEMLAEMIGTTRSRVNFFMNKFRKLGFIQYNGEIHVNNSLLSVVLHE